jgi:ribonuclease I
MSRKWTKTQHTKFSKTMRAKRIKRELKQAPTINKHLQEWGKELQRDEILDAIAELNPGVQSPDTIFVQVNGTLKRYVLRTMPVYVPAEDLK